MKNEISVKLVLTSSLAIPAALTKQLHLEPTLAWRKGDVIRGTTRTYDCNGWTFSSPDSEAATLAGHVDTLLAALEPKAAALNALPQEIDRSISCVIYAREYIPEIYFPAEIIERIARLSLAIDVDLYSLLEE